MEGHLWKHGRRWCTMLGAGRTARQQIEELRDGSLDTQSRQLSLQWEKSSFCSCKSTALHQPAQPQQGVPFGVQRRSAEGLREGRRFIFQQFVPLLLPCFRGWWEGLQGMVPRYWGRPGGARPALTSSLRGWAPWHPSKDLMASQLRNTALDFSA